MKRILLLIAMLPVVGCDGAAPTSPGKPPTSPVFSITDTWAEVGIEIASSQGGTAPGGGGGGGGPSEPGLYVTGTDLITEIPGFPCRTVQFTSSTLGNRTFMVSTEASLRIRTWETGQAWMDLISDTEVGTHAFARRAAVLCTEERGEANMAAYHAGRGFIVPWGGFWNNTYGADV
jgi:hypothetical protein